MTQPVLFDVAPEEPALLCIFGEPFEGEHPLCEAEADRIIAELDETGASA